MKTTLKVYSPYTTSLQPEQRQTIGTLAQLHNADPLGYGDRWFKGEFVFPEESEAYRFRTDVSARFPNLRITNVR